MDVVITVLALAVIAALAGAAIVGMRRGGTPDRPNDPAGQLTDAGPRHEQPEAADPRDRPGGPGAEDDVGG